MTIEFRGLDTYPGSTLNTQWMPAPPKDHPLMQLALARIEQGYLLAIVEWGDRKWEYQVKDQILPQIATIN